MFLRETKGKWDIELEQGFEEAYWMGKKERGR